MVQFASNFNAIRHLLLGMPLLVLFVGIQGVCVLIVARQHERGIRFLCAITAAVVLPIQLSVYWGFLGSGTWFDKSHPSVEPFVVAEMAGMVVSAGLMILVWGLAGMSPPDDSPNVEPQPIDHEDEDPGSEIDGPANPFLSDN